MSDDQATSELPRPITLQQAADMLGPEIDKRLLWRKYRTGRLRA